MSSNRSGFGGIAIVVLLAVVAIAALLAFAGSRPAASGVPAAPAAEGSPLIAGDSLTINPRSVPNVARSVDSVSITTIYTVSIPQGAKGPYPGPMDAPFGPEVRVTSDTNDQTHPSIAVEPGGTVIYVAYTNQVTPTNRDVWLARSTDGGATWTNGAVAAFPYNEYDPAIAVHGSRVFIFYTVDDPTIPRGYRFAMSTDQGLSWAGRQIDFGAGAPFRDIKAPSASSYNGNWLYVTYQAYCDVVGALCPAGNYQLFFVTLFDATGNTIPNPHTIYFPYAADIIEPTVVAGPTNTLVAADYDGTAPPNNGPPGTHDITWTRTPTGTNTPAGWAGLLVPGILSDDFIRAGASAFGTNFVIPYQLVNQSQTGVPNHAIVALYSTNDGTSFLLRLVAGAAGAEYKDPAAGGVAPTAHVTYYRAGDLGYSTSNAPFTSWAPSIKVNSNTGTVVDAIRSNAIVVDSTLGPLVAWHDTRDGNANIYSTGLQRFRVTIATVVSGLQVRFAGEATWSTAPYFRDFTSGSRVTVETRSPQPGTPGVQYAFVAWNDTSTSLSRTFTLTADITWTATFVTQYETTIASNPPGGRTVTVDGTQQPAPYVFWCNATSQHTIAGLPDPQPVSPTSRYRFGSWDDGLAQTHQITCDIPSKTVTATFIQQFLVTIATSPVPLNVTVDGTTWASGTTFWWDTGSSHNLFAISPQSTAPNTQYVFTDWAGGPASQAWRIPVTSSTTYTANYKLQYRVIMATNPTGLELIVDGVTVTAPASFYWDAGSPHNAVATTPQFAGTGTRYTFSAWSTGNPSPSETVTADSAKTVTAIFTTQYFLTMSSNFPGGTVSPGNGWYNAGDVVPISATAPPGSATDRYMFRNWTGDYTGTSPTGSITMNGPKTVQAFWIHEFRIEVQSNPTGQTITVDGGPTTVTTTGALWWAEGSSHTLTAPSSIAVGTDTRWNFASWNGGQVTPTLSVPSVSGAQTIIASYNRQFLVTVVITPAGATVTLDGTAYTAPAWFDETHQLVIATTSPQNAATAGTRYVFTSWSGGASGTAVTVTITVDGVKTVTATFGTQHQLTIESTADGIQVGNPTCQNPADATGCWYTAGSPATAAVTSPFQASNGNKYVLTGWSGAASGAGAFATFTMDGPKTATASWRIVSFMEEFGMWLGLIIAIIVAVVLVLLLMMRRRKKAAGAAAATAAGGMAGTPPPPPPGAQKAGGTKTCTSCGMEIPAGAKSCPVCGAAQ